MHERDARRDVAVRDGLGRLERVDDREFRDVDGRRAAHDPGIERAARLIQRDRVRQAHEVTMREAEPVLVLHELVGEFADRLILVPVAHARTQSASPSPELFDVRSEFQEVRTGAADGLQALSQRQTSRRVVPETGAHRQREDCGRDLRCTTGLRDGDRTLDHAGAVLAHHLREMQGIIERQRTLGRIVRSAFGSEDQKAVDPVPRVERVDEPARAVRDLIALGLGSELRRPGHASVKELLEELHGIRTSFQ